MKCAIFEEHSSLCVVFFRFSGTLFPVSMIDGAIALNLSHGATSEHVPEQQMNFLSVFSSTYC